MRGNDVDATELADDRKPSIESIPEVRLCHV
jgi:hypothetical protein